MPNRHNVWGHAVLLKSGALPNQLVLTNSILLEIARQIVKSNDRVNIIQSYNSLITLQEEHLLLTDPQPVFIGQL